jgi:hypothetical protein
MGSISSLAPFSCMYLCRLSTTYMKHELKCPFSEFFYSYSLPLDFLAFLKNEDSLLNLSEIVLYHQLLYFLLSLYSNCYGLLWRNNFE